MNDLTIKAVYSFRLVPGDDICNGLNDFVLENKLNEPFIMTCVGSVTKAVIDVGQDKVNNYAEITMSIFPLLFRFLPCYGAVTYAEMNCNMV